MLNDGASARTAAYAVRCGSPSRFSGEFKRLFLMPNMITLFWIIWDSP